MKTESIQLAKIRTDGGTQPRAAINPEVVADYRERMEDGDVFPPIVVFFDGTHYWLADGFHRVEAAREADFTTISAQVKQGTVRDAKWFSFGANRDHGQRRDKGDVRRAVEAILADEEWTDKPQATIASHVGCSREFVSRVNSERRATGNKPTCDRSQVTGRDGRTINTANIGRKPAAPSPAPIPPVVESHKAIVNTDTGEVIENAAVVTVTKETPAKETPKVRGVGLDIAYKAIALLQTIPLNDGLRQEALDRVTAWIEHNK
jgi:hypothetical protein